MELSLADRYLSAGICGSATPDPRDFRIPMPMRSMPTSHVASLPIQLRVVVPKPVAQALFVIQNLAINEARGSLSGPWLIAALSLIVPRAIEARARGARAGRHPLPTASRGGMTGTGPIKPAWRLGSASSQHSCVSTYRKVSRSQRQPHPLDADLPTDTGGWRTAIKPFGETKSHSRVGSRIVPKEARSRMKNGSSGPILIPLSGQNPL
jgi:hypothetical protein